MSEPLKLKNPGESVTIVVKSCTKVPVGKYPEWEFVGHDGITVRMPEAAFQRQLKRLDLDAELIVGMTVTIGRSENKSDPSKPYWDLDVSGAKAKAGPVSAGAGGTSHTVATPTSQAAPAPEKEKLNKVYGRCLDHVLTVEVPKLKAAGVPVTHEGVSAMTACLFIASTD